LFYITYQEKANEEQQSNTKKCSIVLEKYTVVFLLFKKVLDESVMKQTAIKFANVYSK